MVLATMRITARIIRIRCHWLRACLFTAAFPALTAGLAWGLLWRQPWRLFTAAPWDMSVTMYWLAVSGAFVGVPLVGNCDER